MRGGGGEADHIQKSATANSDHIGMTVDVVTVDVRMNFRDVKIGILGALTAFDHERAADQLQSIRVGGEVVFDLAGQSGLSLREGFVEDQEDFFRLPRFTGQRLFENEISGFEDVFGKVHTEVVADLNGFSHDRHVFIVTVQSLKSKGQSPAGQAAPNIARGTLKQMSALPAETSNIEQPNFPMRVQ
jgi:hypothetical protein